MCYPHIIPAPPKVQHRCLRHLCCTLRQLPRSAWTTPRLMTSLFWASVLQRLVVVPVDMDHLLAPPMLVMAAQALLAILHGNTKVFKCFSRTTNERTHHLLSKKKLQRRRMIFRAIMAALCSTCAYPPPVFNFSSSSLLLLELDFQTNICCMIIVFPLCEKKHRWFFLDTHTWFCLKTHNNYTQKILFDLIYKQRINHNMKYLFIAKNHQFYNNKAWLKKK